MTEGPARLADAEFKRLRGLLDARGVGDGTCSFADVWSAVCEWMLTGSGEAVSEAFLVGFECSHDPNDRHGDHDHPDPPEDVPKGPLFNVAFFWDFERGGETGVELWYPADDDWKPVTSDPGWDPDHPINYHFWGCAGARASDYIRAVESTPGVQVAARKTPALARLFWTGAPDVLFACTH